MLHTIGVDLGGTNTLVAVVDRTGTVTDEVELVTPTGGPESVLKAIADAVHRLSSSPLAVGVGVPGPVNDGVAVEAPNLEGWNEPVDVAGYLDKAIDAPVVVANDGSIGVYGEATFGAAKDGVNVLGCWLGTGVGGGVIIDGSLFEGSGGAAGELGHVPVNVADPALCGCGRWGCVEAYAGRASMERLVVKYQAQGMSTELWKLMAEKGKDRLTSAVWHKALKRSDPIATRIIDESIVALGAALAGAINLLDVDTVVFGGGLAERLGQTHVDRIRTVTVPRLMTEDNDRTWTVATLGDYSGVIGAAALAQKVSQ